MPRPKPDDGTESRRTRSAAKPLASAPLKLERALTGRYNIATVEGALELRGKDPGAWHKLPADLRRKTEEYEKSLPRMAAFLAQVRAEANRQLAMLPSKFRVLARQDADLGKLSLVSLIPPEYRVTGPAREDFEKQLKGILAEPGAQRTFDLLIKRGLTAPFSNVGSPSPFGRSCAPTMPRAGKRT